MLSLSLEQLTQILRKAGISSSQEEEILIAAKDVITPPEANKEESTSEESCISDEEHMFELEVEKDEELISIDHHVNKSCIKQWFQVSIKLDRFCFCFFHLFCTDPFHIVFAFVMYSFFSSLFFFSIWFDFSKMILGWA